MASSKTTKEKTKSEKHPFAGLNELRASLPDATVPVKSDAELEAAIARAPEDPEPYLVYGDVLQLADDPRGTLIALQYAAQFASGDNNKKTNAVDTFIGQHHHYFLGALAATNDVDVEWFLGFIRRATVRATTIERALDLISLLLALPSARFLRELDIAMPIVQTRGQMVQHAAQIADRLIRIGGPATLAQLDFPIDGGWVPPPELNKVFPLLDKDPGGAWEDAMERAGTIKRSPIVLDEETALPQLEPKRNVAVTTNDQAAILHALSLEVNERRTQLGVVDAMKDAFTAPSLDAFAAALARTESGLGQRRANQNESDVRRMPWAIDLAGAIGGEECVAFLYRDIYELDHADSVSALEALRGIGSPHAICAIYALQAMPSPRLERRRIAGELLSSLANERGVGIDRLVDHACLTPVATTPYDPIPAFVDARRLWLTELLLGRRWTIDEFRVRFAARARELPLLRTLVFCHVGGFKRKLNEEMLFFRLDREGMPRDVADDPCALGEGTVGLAHPIDMEGAAMIGRWRDDILRRTRMVPPIAQLNRPIFLLLGDERQMPVLRRFADRRPAYRTVIDGLQQVDWQEDAEVGGGGDDGDGTTRTFSKRFARDDVTLRAHVVDGAIATVTLWFDDASRRKSFDALHPVVVSEALYDLDLATT